MNNLRRLFPGLVLGLTIAISGAGFAQHAAQSVADKKESCCSASCSCCGDACALKKKDAMKNHSAASEKQECCCGDSCEMKGGVTKNQAAPATQECCARSDSTNSGAKKNKAASGKHECCGGDSGGMKDHAKMTATTMKDGNHACCCCSASCKMDDMKNKSGQ